MSRNVADLVAGDAVAVDGEWYTVADVELFLGSAYVTVETVGGWARCRFDRDALVLVGGRNQF